MRWSITLNLNLLSRLLNYFTRSSALVPCYLWTICPALPLIDKPLGLWSLERLRSLAWSYLSNGPDTESIEKRGV